MRKKIFMLFGVVLLAIVLVISKLYIESNSFLYHLKLLGNNQKYSFDYDWTNKKKYIAHAFGSINGYSYTNSIEAFEENYHKGHRIFEVDFDITNDGVLVCSHDEEYWRNITNSKKEYNYSNFINTKIYGKYTSMDAKKLIDIMNVYKDIYVITDTKYWNKEKINEQFTQLVQVAKDVNVEILDRIIPQIYKKDMLYYVMNAYQFKSIIYTLYQENDWNAESIVKFCKDTGVNMITCNEYKILDDSNLQKWKQNNIIIATHTINDIDKANTMFDDGVDMIYTDDIVDEKAQ